jgi:hypothetical protein|tara:strand:- start:864 stop:992 length:129 start_codon:yes stop_codon:yes gene_type:complete
MAERGFVDVKWIEALREFRSSHNGRNPNTYEVSKLKATLKKN